MRIPPPKPAPALPTSGHCDTSRAVAAFLRRPGMPIWPPRTQACSSAFPPWISVLVPVLIPFLASVPFAVMLSILCSIPPATLLAVPLTNEDKPQGVPTTTATNEHSHQVDFDHSHAVLDGLLREFVRDGRVDYAGLRERRLDLQDYLATLGILDEQVFQKDFSRAQQLALLINAYNAFTLELILEHYPVASIQDIPGNWTEPRWLLLGRKMNLNDIENKVIRPRFGEPRIHFALVCAAKSCPPLRAEAYVADRLEEQLAEATHLFTRDPRANRLDMASATLQVSRIFEWYARDFAAIWGETEVPRGSDTSAEHRGVVGFFMAQLRPAEADFLRRQPVTLQYLEYDWDLNDRPVDWSAD